MIALKKCFLAAAAAIIGLAASAQQRTMKGTVFDETSQPLAGASVSVPNTMRGVTTDGNGQFEIQASDTETLSVSFLGYLTQEVKVAGRNVINVTLEQTPMNLKSLS